MVKPDETMMNVNPNNLFANNDTWYSSLDIASYYVKNEKDCVYEYETKRQVVLLSLMNKSNCNMMVTMLINKQKALVKKLLNNKNYTYYPIKYCYYEEHKIDDSDSRNEYILSDFSCYNNFIMYLKNNNNNNTLIKKILEIEEYVNIIKITTGYDLSWDEQFKLIQERMDNILPNRNAPESTFTDESGNIIVYQINEEFYSHKKEHLNRCSITLSTDKKLCEAVQFLFNVDGYIAPTVPSLYHRYGIFHNEIGIFSSRGIIDLTKSTCHNYDLDINSYPQSNLLFQQLIKEEFRGFLPK
jgi:hypothetical protein